MTCTLTYDVNYLCDGLCADAPSIAGYTPDAVPVYAQMLALTEAPTEVTVDETYGALITANKGFVVFVVNMQTQTAPKVANNFALTVDQSVPVYSVTKDAVSTAPIGSYAPKADDTTVLEFSPAEGVAVADLIPGGGPGAYSFATRWAVPVYDAGMLFPSDTVSTVAVTSGVSTHFPFIIDNGVPVFTSVATAPVEIHGYESFDMVFEFESNHLDALTLSVDLTSAPANTTFDCVDAEGEIIPQSSSADGVITMDFPTASANTTAEAGKAGYYVKCTPTAWAVEDAAAIEAPSVTFSVLRDSEVEHTKEAQLPAVT
jgi:hypothetical protein